MDQFTYAERATDWRGNNNIAESIFEQLSLEQHPVPTWIVVGAGTGGTSATIGRGGQGLTNIGVPESNPGRNGPVVASFPVKHGSQLMLVTDQAKLIRLPIELRHLLAGEAKGPMQQRAAECSSSANAASGRAGSKSGIENETRCIARNQQLPFEFALREASLVEQRRQHGCNASSRCSGQGAGIEFLDIAVNDAQLYTCAPIKFLGQDDDAHERVACAHIGLLQLVGKAEQICDRNGPSQQRRRGFFSRYGDLIKFAFDVDPG